MKNALIIHGTDGFPEENWYPWLKQKLEEQGYHVDVPQFPTPEGQTPEEWFKVLKPYMGKFDKHTVLIGHSCGALFLLRVLENLDKKIRAAIFVAPSVGILPVTYIDKDRPFLSGGFDWDKIRRSAEHFLVFHSEDDPYICIENGQKVADELGVELVRESNAGHFNTKAGFTTFRLLWERMKRLCVV